MRVERHVVEEAAPFASRSCRLALRSASKYRRQSQRCDGISVIASTLSRMFSQNSRVLLALGSSAGDADDRDVGRRGAGSGRPLACVSSRRCASSARIVSDLAVQRQRSVMPSRSVATWPSMYMPSACCCASVSSRKRAVFAAAVAPLGSDAQAAEDQLIQHAARFVGRHVVRPQFGPLAEEVARKRRVGAAAGMARSGFQVHRALAVQHFLLEWLARWRRRRRSLR